VPALEWGQCHVGKALQVQFEDAEIQRLLDQEGCLLSGVR